MIKVRHTLTLKETWYEARFRPKITIFKEPRKSDAYISISLFIMTRPSDSDSAYLVTFLETA